jgi:type I restriction enzyme S subunit
MGRRWPQAGCGAAPKLFVSAGVRQGQFLVRSTYFHQSAIGNRKSPMPSNLPTSSSQLLSYHFATLAETPDAVAKLRNFILSLAVRGQILPQNSADEKPEQWREFVAKVAQTKTQDEEAPFDLPKSWRWVRLNDVADYAAADKVDPSEIKDGDWVLDLEEIEKDTSRVVRMASFAEKQSSSTKAKFLPGDVLYGKLRPYLNKVVVAPQAGFCTTEIVPIRSRGLIEPSYLCVFLRSPDFVGYANSKSYGMKMPRLGTDDAVSAWIAVPPPAEQRRIVAKVEELLALCDELEAAQTAAREHRTCLVRSAIDHLTTAKAEPEFRQHAAFVLQHSDLVLDSVSQLRQAILSLAVQGHIGTPDKSKWQTCKLRDVVTLITSGSRGWAEFYADEGPLFLRAQNVRRDGSLLLEDVAHVRLPKKSEGLRTRVQKDDLLVVITGAGVSQATRVKDDLGEAYVSQHVALIRLREPAFASWLDFQFHAPAGCFGQLQELIYGAKPGLNLENLRELELSVPPLAEQQRIVAKVDELLRWCDALEARLTTAQTTAEHLLDATLHQILTA